MTQDHEESIYEGVRRMVFWDEPRDEVLHRLEVNGIASPKAVEMYERARTERIVLIRQDSLRTAAWGVLLLAAGGGMFAFFLVRPERHSEAAFQAVRRRCGHRWLAVFSKVSSALCSPHRRRARWRMMNSICQDLAMSHFVEY